MATDGSSSSKGNAQKLPVNLHAEIADHVGVVVGAAKQCHLILRHRVELAQHALYGDLAPLEFPAEQQSARVGGSTCVTGGWHTAAAGTKPYSRG